MMDELCEMVDGILLELDGIAGEWEDGVDRPKHVHRSVYRSSVWGYCKMYQMYVNGWSDHVFTSGDYAYLLERGGFLWETEDGLVFLRDLLVEKDPLFLRWMEEKAG